MEKKANFELARVYLRNQRFQEAIWTFRKIGKVDLAETLENTLKSVMLSNEFNISKEGGFGDVFIGRFGDNKVLSNNAEGVFKTIEGFENEVLAYRLDKLLGLNIVPLTFFYNHPKYGRGSMQYYIKNVKKNDSARGRDVNFRKYGYPKNQNGMWLLDYLLNNMDRHGYNWFKRPGGHVVAIDHDSSLNGRVFNFFSFLLTGAKLTMQLESLPDGEVLRRLIKLKPSDFDGLGVDTQKIFKKRDMIVKEVERLRPGVICHQLFF
ncbi:MAG: hypothetical protein HOO06_15960 [Bdellovibrionaceae bacterium]|nr:hypothetical protein [Pseudobdellovibrionaceae bacterium]